MFGPECLNYFWRYDHFHLCVFFLKVFFLTWQYSSNALQTIKRDTAAQAMVVLVLEIAKGFLPAWLALHYAPAGSRTWLAALTVASAVAGHCWPILAGFRGGMGLATGAGGLLAASPLAFLIAAAILIFLTLLLHHGARASVVTALMLAPAFWLAGLRGPEFGMASAGGIVLVVRWRTSWNRRYRELWLDREQH